MNANGHGTLTPALARALVRSLTRGTSIPKGVRHLHVGHDRWIAAQEELLDEIAEDGYSDTKFVRGAYGSGKSHFLSLVQDIARERGWATSHVECKADGVQIDRLDTLYPALAAKLTLPATAAATAEPGDAMTDLLDLWVSRVLKDAGVAESHQLRPMTAVIRVHETLQRTLLRGNVPTDLGRALTAYARASLAGDATLLRDVRSWLQGAPERVRIPGKYLANPVGSTGRADHDLRPIAKATVSEAMRGLLWIVRAAGCAGLVLCIDEIEELAKLGNQRRQDQALQALREHVDNAGGDSGFRNLLLYLAATPEMFDSERYFPRYDALATRIQSLGGPINWRAPVIDLDRTPLSAEEMRLLALRVRDVHRVAHGAAATAKLTKRAVTALVDSVAASRFRVAKPRLLTRLVVDELERARQQGPDYELPADVAAAVARLAGALRREADA